MFRAQREKVLKEKEEEQRRATIEFLAGERQAGGSGDTAQELDPEEFAREQLRLLVRAPFTGGSNVLCHAARFRFISLSSSLSRIQHYIVVGVM